MPSMMEHPMEKKAARSDVDAATSDETAIELARRWLIELMGPRGWNDTHESMIAKVAKKVAMNPRRARMIIQRERQTKVSGDEILAIQRARAALESFSALAGAADARANSEAGGQGEGGIREGNTASWATTRAAPGPDR